MTKTERLKKSITASNLLAAAGSIYFQRGEGYAESDRVRDLRVRGGQLCALVDGSYLYETLLYEIDGELEGECSCPLGEQEEFCKHLVATGLAWIRQGKGGTGDDGEGRSDTEILTAWLKKLKKAELVDLVVNRCHEDGDFFDQLLVRASAAQSTGNLAEMKRSIQQAYRIHGFVDWRDSYSYTRKLDQITESLRGMLDAGKAPAVVELVEYALERWEIAIQNIDDSDGGMGGVLDDLHGLHHAAAKKAKPDGRELAERLFGIKLSSGWDFFTHAYEAYADVWGKAGKGRYRELVEAEWNKLPQIKPNGGGSGEYGNPSWLSGLMVRFAQEDGDFEYELEIMQRNLSGAWNFLELARRCEEEQQPERAVQWLEEGRKHFKDDFRLDGELAGLYWKLRRYDEALSVYWKLFEMRHGLDTYKTLLAHAKKRKCLDEWRNKALGSIRADIEKRQKQAKRQHYWVAHDHSLLVEIFLWEKDAEQAWREAAGGGCSNDLWLKLCKAREGEHPAEVFPVYLQLAEKQVGHKNNDAYRVAVRHIGKAGELAKSCGKVAEFDAASRQIQVNHKPKRNFMKYMSEAGLRTI